MNASNDEKAKKLLDKIRDSRYPQVGKTISLAKCPGFNPEDPERQKKTEEEQAEERPPDPEEDEDGPGSVKY